MPQLSTLGIGARPHPPSLPPSLRLSKQTLSYGSGQQPMYSHLVGSSTGGGGGGAGGGVMGSGLGQGSAAGGAGGEAKGRTERGGRLLNRRKN